MFNSKKNVSDIYKMSLQRLSVTPPHKCITTNLVPGHLFTLNWRTKISKDKVVSQRERKVLPCFVRKGRSGKCFHTTFFISMPTHHYLTTDWNWREPNNFVMAAKVVNYFRKKARSYMFDRVLNSPMTLN